MSSLSWIWERSCPLMIWQGRPKPTCSPPMMSTSPNGTPTPLETAFYATGDTQIVAPAAPAWQARAAPTLQISAVSPNPMPSSGKPPAFVLTGHSLLLPGEHRSWAGNVGEGTALQSTAEETRALTPSHGPVDTTGWRQPPGTPSDTINPDQPPRLVVVSTKTCAADRSRRLHNSG